MKRSKASCAAFIAGAAILGAFILFSVAPVLVAPYGVKEMFRAWQPISQAHFLGTNDMGFDIFSEIIFAARNTLITGIAAAAISLVLGTAIGLWAGYASKWEAEIAGGIINVFLLIPMLPAAIVVAAFLGPALRNIILVIAILGWCATARAVRARTAHLKQSAFVESLVILQIPRTRILFRHILPNLREIILARYILSVSTCMMIEAALSFIGLGDPSSVTWGRMVNLAYRNGGFARGAYNWFLAPGICIMLCALSFYLINYYFENRSAGVSGGQSYLEM